MFKNPHSLLKIGLLGNAIFSFCTGLALVLASGPIAIYIGVLDSRFLLGVGIALLPFALHLWQASRRVTVRRGEIYYLSALDGLWVLGSAVILLSGWVPFTSAGVWVFSFVALAVADFGLLQWLGVRRLSHH